MTVRDRFVVIVALGLAATLPAAAAPAFTLTSPDFAPNGRVAERFVLNAYGCSGGNISPTLEWHDAPAGTKSFAITLFDRDERTTPSGWWHWVLYNLPPSTSHLASGAGAEHSTALPAGAVQGRSDLGTDAYHGPCPEKGDPPHHYLFTIYALSVDKLDVPPEASGAMVTSIAHDVTLGTATFTGLYGR